MEEGEATANAEGSVGTCHYSTTEYGSRQSNGHEEGEKGWERRAVG